MFTTDPEGRDTIQAAFLDRLERDEPEAWSEFFQRVYPSAREAIDHALTARDGTAVKEARRLVKAFPQDPDGARGALEAAWDSFRGHFFRKDRPPEEIRTASDFAAWLIGVAYNRWQRERYRETQMHGQAALGSATGPGSGGPTVLDQYADPREGPEVEVDLADFRRALVEELRKFTEHLSDVDRRIIHLSFFEGLKPQEISALVGVSVAKCKEMPRLWLRHLAQRYPFTLDFLRDDLGEDRPGTNRGIGVSRTGK